MNARQIVLPLRPRQNDMRANSNRDLVGRSYNQDKYTMIKVTDICADNPRHVVVQRSVDGKVWTMPGWLVRLILLHESKRAA